MLFRKTLHTLEGVVEDDVRVLLGLAIPVAAAGYYLVGFKILLIIAFIFIFNPTATHALARGGWVIGEPPWTRKDGGDDHDHEPHHLDGPADTETEEAD